MSDEFIERTRIIRDELHKWINDHPEWDLECIYFAMLIHIRTMEQVFKDKLTDPDEILSLRRETLD